MSDRIILFVEDDPILQMVGKMAVKHLGFKCEVVATGEKAYERAKDELILIFMDVGLPGIDGLEATRLIRAKELAENARHVPIVALTGHAIREKCLEAGMDDFLQKPALIEDLDLMIKKWITQIEDAE